MPHQLDYGICAKPVPLICKGLGASIVLAVVSAAGGLILYPTLDRIQLDTFTYASPNYSGMALVLVTLAALAAQLLISLIILIIRVRDWHHWRWWAYLLVMLPLLLGVALVIIPIARAS